MTRSKYLSSLFVCSLTIGAALAADTAGEHRGLYIGVFGGMGSTTATSLRQRGAVFLNPPNSLPILPVDANGSTGSGDHVNMGGAHLGYEWNHWNLGSGWGLKPAAELEGVYFGKYSPVGDMPVTPSFLGTQYVTVPMTVGAFLANAVFTLQTPYSDKTLPYIGVGVGVAFVSISGSDSANPSEPGINHFNSDPDASDSALVMQLKVGVKRELCKNLYLFTEYRYLFIDSTEYTFGSTDYPGLHLPTTHWQVNLGHQQYNLLVAGLQYKF